MEQYLRDHRMAERGQIMNTQPIVSIIIPVHNNLGYTRKCLKALRGTVRNLAHELIVVDNASTDGTKEYLSALNSVRSLRNDHNCGFARACNQGAAVASGDFLLFLNNDTIPRRGWLTALLDVAASDSSIAIAGSKLLYPDGRIQHAGVAFAPGETSPAPFHIYRYESANAPHVNKQRCFQAVTGACMFVRRLTFGELGGFDEDYLNGYEDVDLCLRARERGHRVIYEPRSVVTHYESKTPGRFLQHSENLKLFKARWAGRVLPDYHHYAEADGQEPWIFRLRDALYEARVLYIEGRTVEGDAVWDAVGDRLRAKLVGPRARFPTRRDFNLPGPEFADKMLALVPGTPSWVPMHQDFQTDFLAWSAAALYAFAENHSAARYFLLQAILHRPINVLKPRLALLMLKILMPIGLTRAGRRTLSRLRRWRLRAA
jgi:GT2 family glycosyltransferase